jgi:hypothetical protein
MDECRPHRLLLSRCGLPAVWYPFAHMIWGGGLLEHWAVSRRRRR